jgi:hypothetical protein
LACHACSQQRHTTIEHRRQQLQHNPSINPHSISAPSNNCAAVGPIATTAVGTVVAGPILGSVATGIASGCGTAPHHRHHRIAASPAFLSFATIRQRRLASSKQHHTVSKQRVDHIDIGVR